MTKLEEEITQAKLHKGYAICFAPNGGPDYVEKTTLADFACVQFTQLGEQWIASLEDDGYKEVYLDDTDQLDDLIAAQTFNRGDFFTTKKDCLAALDYKLKSGDITEEKYNSLVDDLENC